MRAVTEAQQQKAIEGQTRLSDLVANGGSGNGGGGGAPKRRGKEARHAPGADSSLADKVLLLMECMTEGHYMEMQDFLRSQPNMRTQVNLVIDLVIGNRGTGNGGRQVVVPRVVAELEGVLDAAVDRVDALVLHPVNIHRPLVVVGVAHKP